MDKVNLKQKLRLFRDHWTPKIVGELNDSYVKLVKLKGDFIWHHHEKEDELFLVVKGKLLIQLKDRDIWLDEGESPTAGCWPTTAPATSWWGG